MNADEGNCQGSVMLCKTVPGHHVFKYLRPSKTSTLFHSVPKTNRLAELCLKILERDGRSCDGFKVIRTREMGVACELQFTFDAQRQT